MTIQDIVFGALCAWRENRGGGIEGMQSVINVLDNRARERSTSIYDEVIRPLQFSSMTSKGDPELILFPSRFDSAWIDAQALMERLDRNDLPDITNGATFYYAKTMLIPPHWAGSLERCAEIAGQLFFRPPINANVNG